MPICFLQKFSSSSPGQHGHSHYFAWNASRNNPICAAISARTRRNVSRCNSTSVTAAGSSRLQWNTVARPERTGFLQPITKHTHMVERRSYKFRRLLRALVSAIDATSYHPLTTRLRTEHTNSRPPNFRMNSSLAGCVARSTLLG